jgi:hypothetical protein
MQLHHLPWIRVVRSPFRNHLALLGGNPANAGTIALDTAGDVFFTDTNQLMELPKTATGYGPQVTLPAAGSQLAAADGAGDVFLAESGSVLELQTHSVNFEGVNACGPGQTTPPPCSETLTFNFTVNAGVTLGTPKVLTGGAPGLDFTLASGSSCTGAIAAGSSCIVNVTFTPLAVGVKTGAVEITDSGGNVLATTMILGAGLPVATGSPVAQVPQTSLEFGALTFDSAETLPLTINNIGQGVLIVAPSINGQSYTITGSTCGLGITGGNSCTLEVQFSPVSVGAHNNILTVQTNEPSSIAIDLEGVANGVDTTTKALQFGTIPFGITEVLPLTFTNTTTSGTVMLGAVPTSPSYKILNTPQNTCQSGVPAGQSCTLPVQFSPAVVGAHDDFLNLTPSADAPYSFVRLDGFASGVGTELATPLNFGTIPDGTTAVLPLTITNFGVAGTITIGTAINGNSFEVLTTADNTCVAGITAGQSCVLPVQFSPMSVGAHNEQLTLAPSGGAAASIVHLDGIASGVPLGQIVTFVGAQTDFGDVIPSSVAVDGAGDVFTTDFLSEIGFGNVNILLEFPRTATGYGPLTGVFGPGIVLPVNCPGALATDGEGDLFAEACGNTVVELPRTANGFGTQTTVVSVSGALPAMAADGPGDLFLLLGTDVVEVPKTATGYGPQTTLPASGLAFPSGIALDGAGNLFIADSGDNQVLELPRTAMGYGPQTTAVSGLMGPGGIAVDGTDDIFVVENGTVVKLPWTATGYGPPLTILPPGGIIYPVGLAADSAGDVFVSEGNNMYFPGDGPMVEIQTRSVNFYSANVCAPGQTTPAPCSATLTLNFNVNVDVTLGTPNVLTGGAPNLDFTLASGNTCTGAIVGGISCTVNVTFTPLAAGIRNGDVEITDGAGKVLTTVPISGTGIAN